MARDVRVAILGDARDFSRAVGQVQRDTRRLDGTFSGIKKLAGGLALGFAAREVFDLGKGFVDAAIESQKVTKQTDAVIKSMGGAANVTADQVSKLSTALSLKSGIDDELIQSGSNVLLTFGKIRNEVGKGNDVFDRANAAALDMSVAMGVDMKTASIQVGKALNDPIKGITALQKAGVSFTDEQKKRIKWLVENNRAMDAQKIILDELGRQFGGSAEAQATATDKLKVAWGNIQEQLGAKLLPVVEKVATFLAENLPAAFDRASSFIEQNKTLLIGLAAVVGGILTAAFVAWGASVIAATWPIIAIGAAIAAVTAGVIYAYTHWGWFKTAVDAVARFLTQSLWPALQTIVSFIRNEVIPRVADMIKRFVEFHMRAAAVAAGVVQAFVGLVQWFAGLPGTIGRYASMAWNALKNGLAAAVNYIVNQIDRALGPIDELLGKLARVPNMSLTGGVDWRSKLNMDEHARGGVVAGALGQPRMILAHGGERITQASARHRDNGGGSGGGGNTIIIQVGDREIARLYADGKVRADRRGFAA